MDQYNKIQLNIEDGVSFLNAISSIHILQKEINDLEFTGEFEQDDQQNCQHIINSLLNIIMKKTIIIDHQ